MLKVNSFDKALNIQEQQIMSELNSPVNIQAFLIQSLTAPNLFIDAHCGFSGIVSPIVLMVHYSRRRLYAKSVIHL